MTDENGKRAVAEEAAAHEDAPELDAEVFDAEVLDAEVLDADVLDEGTEVPADPADGGSGDAESAAADVDADISELLESTTRERDEYLDLAQRTRADFDNFRKRAANEAATARVRGKTELATDLIVVIDNLERALTAAEVDPSAALAGEVSVDVTSGSTVATSAESTVYVNGEPAAAQMSKRKRGWIIFGIVAGAVATAIIIYAVTRDDDDVTSPRR